MATPEEATTTINVKNVRSTAWERAKLAANRQGETMGEWLSRAIDHLANLESGQREIAPGKPVKPTAELLAEIAPVVGGNLADMTREARSSVSALVDAHIRESQGLPPRPVRVPPPRLAGRKAEPQNGQSGLAGSASLPALPSQ